MPNSKHRKRQLAANRRQLEKAKKKLLLQTAREQECDKENQLSPNGVETDFQVEKVKEDAVDNHMDILNDTTTTEGGDAGEDLQQKTSEDIENESTWLKGLYSWCQSGIVQVIKGQTHSHILPIIAVHVHCYRGKGGAGPGLGSSEGGSFKRVWHT